ncbi:TlpA family protein disulfide reductase [Cohnella faecalis]|uniref:TlpA family protein disulfide reductase n=1 Tax=Cohnella faecalis TaxID=2315694 RepID=UPI00360CFB21
MELLRKKENPINVINESTFSSWNSTEVKLPITGTQVLFFISLHCTHCIDLTPSLSEIKQEFTNIDFVLFSTGDNEDNQEMSKYFNWEFPVVHLNQSGMELQFGINRLPYMILVVDGNIILSGVVYNKSDFSQLVTTRT